MRTYVSPIVQDDVICSDNDNSDITTSALAGYALAAAQGDKDATVRCAALEALCGLESGGVWDLTEQQLVGALLWSTANDDSKAVRY